MVYVLYEDLTGGGAARMTMTIDDARIRSLATAARTLGRSAQLDTMLEVAAEEALRALAAASVSISRLEQGTGTVRTVINVGSLGPSEQRWPDQEIYRLDDFRQLQTVVSELRIWTMSLEDTHLDAKEVALLTSLGKGSSMGAPLVVDGKLWGELYATRTTVQARFSDTDIAYTEALAAILSGAISRALHVDALERMAFHDPLTGLANRRALDDAAAVAFDVIADRSGRRVSVVSADVNKLKQVNDELGHFEGDRLISQVATILRREFAALPGSLVARVGGDEFTVLVAGHSVDDVVAAATRACTAAGALPHGAGISCGIASTSRSYGPRTGPHLFRVADAAQYRAKRDCLTTPCIDLAIEDRDAPVSA